MKLRKSTTLALALSLVLGLAVSAFAYPTVYPTGTTIYDTEKAYSSFILITPIGLEKDGTYLMDMNGNVVHDWNDAFDAQGIVNAVRSVLLENGNLLVMSQQAREPRALFEFDWDGNLVWKWVSTDDGVPHHYQLRLDNGNTLVLSTENISAEQTAHAEDYDGPWFGTIRRQGIPTKSDIILEINPAGEIVWKWSLFEDPFFDLDRWSPIDPVADWTHTNTCSVIPENKWYDAGDERFRPGNLLVNPRNLDIIVIVDKESKQVVWSYESDYRGGFAHIHEPEMIAKGYPGAGNILLFDNGLFTKDRAHTGASYILEVDPMEKEIVWTYGASNFFSPTRSSQTRLPNGNTLISEDDMARVFQVTPDGETVWEYQGNYNAHMRTRPIAYDYCPQLAALPRSEQPVATPDLGEYHIPLL